MIVFWNGFHHPCNVAFYKVFESTCESSVCLSLATLQWASLDMAATLCIVNNTLCCHCRQTELHMDKFAVCYLVPVLTGVVDLSHRAWLQDVDEPMKQKKKKKKQGFKRITAATNQRGLSHLLAQQDSIFQALHEVFPHPFTGQILDPEPQLFLLMRVVLSCQLRKRSEVKRFFIESSHNSHCAHITNKSERITLNDIVKQRLKCRIRSE